MRAVGSVVFLWWAAIVVNAGTSDNAWDLYMKQGESLEQAGNYAAAATALEAALREAAHGDGSAGDARYRQPLTLHNLGAVYRELGRYADGERCYKRAIAFWEANQPQRALELASSLHNLGALNLVQGRLSRAEPLYRRALEIRTGRLGSADPAVASTLHGLAQVLHERRRYDEAMDVYSRAGAILEAAYGSGSLAVADILNDRGLLLADMRRGVEARPLFNRAAAIYQKTAPYHPKLAIMLRNLADLDAKDGDSAAAELHFDRSLQICRAALPADHPQTGAILQAYGKFLLRTRRKPEAKAALDRAAIILAKAAEAGGAAYTVDVFQLAAR